MKAGKLFARILRSQWTRAALFWGLLAFCALLLSQLTLPPEEDILPPAAKRDRARFYRDVFKPLFVRNAGMMVTRGNSRLEQSFRLPKPEGALRVFLVGGSLAEGLESSPYWIEFTRALARAHGTGTAEIINAGRGGYDSFRALRVVRELADYEADIIIILSGNNEALYARPLAAAQRWAQTLERVRILNFLGRFLPEPQARSPERKLSDYAANIAAMADAAKRGGARAVLCTLPLNAGQFAPEGGFPADSAYIRAWLALEQKDFETASASVKRYRHGNPASALGAYLEGRIMRALDRPQAARANFDKALNLDYGNLTRSCPAANALVRKAAEKQGAVLADTEQSFRLLQAAEEQQAKIFIDECHVTKAFSLHLLNALLAAVSPGARPLNAIESGPGERAMEHIYPFVTQGMQQSRPAFLTDNMFSRFRTVCIFEGADRVVSTLEDRLSLEPRIRDFAAGLDFRWSLLDMHAGEALRRMGEKAHARRFLKRAQESGLGAWPLFLSLSLLEHDAGDETEARRLMDKALAAAGNAARGRDTVSAFRQCLFADTEARAE